MRTTWKRTTSLIDLVEYLILSVEKWRKRYIYIDTYISIERNARWWSGVLTTHDDEIVIVFGRLHRFESFAEQGDLLLGEHERVQQAHEREKLRARAHLGEARTQVRIRAGWRDWQVVRHSGSTYEKKRIIFDTIEGYRDDRPHVQLVPTFCLANCQQIVAVC